MQLQILNIKDVLSVSYTIFFIIHILCIYTRTRTKISEECQTCLIGDRLILYLSGKDNTCQSNLITY